jgi:hypothetical protein
MVDTGLHVPAVSTLILDSICGEGRCPVVPLVFKTSLGVVRLPEGSTPSLLRQESFFIFSS